MQEDSPKEAFSRKDYSKKEWKKEWILQRTKEDPSKFEEESVRKHCFSGRILVGSM